MKTISEINQYLEKKVISICEEIGIYEFKVKGNYIIYYSWFSDGMIKGMINIRNKEEKRRHLKRWKHIKNYNYCI